jgi:hypothetical protein
MAGINRALSEHSHIAKVNAATQAPCIFLSHISVDGPSAIAVRRYIIKNGGIDIYLAVHDVELQKAVSKNDAVGITNFIERGLSRSTHIMCLVSARTVKSWWVPYELGFAKNAGKHLATLKLRGKIELPSYLEIRKTIHGTGSLNEYLKRVRHGSSKIAAGILTETLISNDDPQHPLDDYLDWNR